MAIDSKEYVARLPEHWRVAIRKRVEELIAKESSMRRSWNDTAKGHMGEDHEPISDFKIGS